MNMEFLLERFAINLFCFQELMDKVFIISIIIFIERPFNEILLFSCLKFLMSNNALLHAKQFSLNQGEFAISEILIKSQQ